MRLYNRSVSSYAERVADDRMVLEGFFIDTFHELNVTLEVRLPDLTIVAARAEMQRSPYALCADVMKRVEALVGKTAGAGIGKVAREALGGPEGCSHLEELVLEAVRSAIQAEFVASGQGLNEEEKVEVYRRKWQNTCYAWSRI